MPNVTGKIGNGGGDRFGIFYPTEIQGAFYTDWNNRFCDPSGNGHWDRVKYAYYNSSRSSNQYINNLNEVRVKSIISNGYIRLY